MSGTKISALDAVATPAGTDVVAVVQGGSTKRETLTQVLSIEQVAANITGGSIDGVVIGGTTPAAGNFTTGDFTGEIESGGNVRIPNASVLRTFNNAGTANVDLIGANASDQVVVGVDAQAAGVTIGMSGVDTTVAGDLSVAGTTSVNDRLDFDSDRSATSPASIYRDATLGMVLYGHAGTSRGFTLSNDSGNYVLYNPVGTQNAVFANDVTVGGDLTVNTDKFTVTASTGRVTMEASQAIVANANDGYLHYAGGNAGNTGSNLLLYGGAHATKAGDFEWREGASTIFGYDASAGKFTLTGNLTVSGTGPHLFGVAVSPNVQFYLGGSFTAGAALNAFGGYFGSTITAASGTTASIAGSRFDHNITTQNNSETIADVSQLVLQEPTITKGTDTITNASTLHILSAPTEGTNNYAILVDSGDVKFGGNLSVSGVIFTQGDVNVNSGVVRLYETTTPSAVANYGKIYTKSDNKLYFQDGAGTEHEVAFV